MTADELKRNIEYVTQRIDRAAASVGHKVTLVAATKTVPADAINTAVEFGITDVGENRVQEYLAKRDAVQRAKWHFIGTLQRNKAKYLVGNVALIQSVNSEALALEISRIAQKLGVVQDVLIEVEPCGETQKTGVPIAGADALIDFVRGMNGVRVRGIMSVPPRDAGDEVYKRLYALYDKNRRDGFDTLSVGMSGDYERAILNGADTVRIGSAIFGKRV